MYLITVKIEDRVKIVPKQTGKDVIELYARLTLANIKKGLTFKFMHTDRYTASRTIEEYTFEFTPSGIELIAISDLPDLPLDEPEEKK